LCGHYSVFTKKVNMKLRLLTAVTGTAMLMGLVSCKKNPGGPEGTDGGKIVYTISNDYHDNANAVLAYRQNADGTLTALPGSPFLTGGSGVANPTEALGPDDSDNPIADQFGWTIPSGRQRGQQYDCGIQHQSQRVADTSSWQPLCFRRSDAVQCGDQRAFCLCGQ
jgi:hypothetical protein